MRRQWPCSKCGFACSSIICSTCKPKEKAKISIHNSPQPLGQIGIINNTNEGATLFPSKNPSSNDRRIEPSSTSFVQHNMTFTVSQIFGSLPYDHELLAIPLKVVHDSDYQPSCQEKGIGKSNVAVKEEHCEIGFHNHFYCGSTSLKTSTSISESENAFRMKQEYDCQHTDALKYENLSIWDPNKVHKKRRSKLPQYTPSPLARLLKQLHHVYHSKTNKIWTLNRVVDSYNLNKNCSPKYDDVLIYEKCKHVGENEIGIGAKLLSSSPLMGSSRNEGFYKPRYGLAYSTTSSSEESGYSFYCNCLIDVPITQVALSSD